METSDVRARNNWLHERITQPPQYEVTISHHPHTNEPKEKKKDLGIPKNRGALTQPGKMKKQWLVLCRR